MDPTSNLAAYQNADPETRKLIQKQLAHNEWMDRAGVYLQWGGLISGLFVALAFLGGAIYVSVSDHPFVGGTMSVVDVASVAAVFVGTSGGRKALRAEG